MDKILDRKSFEVRGHWPLWRGRKKQMTTQTQQLQILVKWLKVSTCSYAAFTTSELCHIHKVHEF